MRRMFGIVINRLLRNLKPPLNSQIAARIRIHVKARPVAAGNVQANPMSLLEDIGRWIQLKDELVDFPRFQ